MDSPQKFSSSESASSEKAVRDFVQWMRENREEGFIVNLKTRTSGMIHRVGCFHIGAPEDWKPEWGDLTKTPKVCDADRGVLERWARTKEIHVDVCSHCLG